MKKFSSVLFLFILFLILWSYKSLFHKKIIVLLCLEGSMLVLITIFVNFSSLNCSCMFILIFFSIFMVMDSVFGITLLTTSSRVACMEEKIIS